MGLNGIIGVKLMDRGQQETERILKSIEKRINHEYATAMREIEDELSVYFAKFEKKDETWRRWVASGERTKEEYQQWRIGQMAVGRRWADQKDAIARQLVDTSKTALGYVRKYSPEIYAENFNYSTYQVEHMAGINTPFTLWSKESVNRIVEQNPDIAPPVGKKLAAQIAEGKAIKWNKQQLQSVMIQGILQGDSIPKLATRLATKMADKDRKASIRNARTISTGVQNAGRVDAYKRAEDIGVDLEQMWMATMDNRTRHSHRWLDGEVRPVGEAFSNGCEYPADPKGDPAEIYNCRCSLRGVVKGLQPKARQYRDTSAVGGMSYDEWRNAKATSGKITKPDEVAKSAKKSYLDEYSGVKNTVLKESKFHSTKLEKSLGSEYSEFRDLVQKSPNKGMYEKFADAINEYKRNDKVVSYLDNSKDEIIWKFRNFEGVNKWTTLAHESGHWFDKSIGQIEKLSWKEVTAVNNACRRFEGAVDKLNIRPSNSDKFLLALRKDMSNLKESAKSGELKTLLTKDMVTANITHSVQDVVNGFYGTSIMYGHEERYWNRIYSDIKSSGKVKELKDAYRSLGVNIKTNAEAKQLTRQYGAASEAWAHISSGVTVGGDQLKVYEEYMPNALQAYKDIINEVM